MGRPDRGIKAQTPVGYSHDTRVSAGAPVTAAMGVVSGNSEGSWVCPGAGDSTADTTVPELRRPLVRLHGVGGAA